MKYTRVFHAFWEVFKIDLNVRRADISDAEAIAGIEEACILSPWTKDMIREELSLEHALYLIAEAGGVPVGFIGASAVLDAADITNVAVLREHRRCGAGYALVTAVVKALSERGVKEVFLEVREGSAPAIALYRACGFEHISLRRAYYKNPTEDALVMKREI